MAISSAKNGCHLWQFYQQLTLRACAPPIRRQIKRDAQDEYKSGDDFGARACTDSSACTSPQENHAGQWLRIGIAAVFAGQGMMFSLALSMTPPPFASLAYQFLHAGLILSALFVCILLGGPLLRALMDMFQQGTVSIAALFFLSLCGAFAGSLVSTFTEQ